MVMFVASIFECLELLCRLHRQEGLSAHKRNLIYTPITQTVSSFKIVLFHASDDV
jgi:hypothetical protein